MTTAVMVFLIIGCVGLPPRTSRGAWATALIAATVVAASTWWAVSELQDLRWKTAPMASLVACFAGGAALALTPALRAERLWVPRGRWFALLVAGAGAAMSDIVLLDWIGESDARRPEVRVQVASYVQIACLSLGTGDHSRGPPRRR